MQLNFTYNFRTTLPCLVLTIFIVLSRPRTIPFCYEIYQPPPLGWSTYSTMSMQIDPAFGYICFNELRNAVSREEAVPLRKGHKSLSCISKSLQSEGSYFPHVFIARYFARIARSTLFPSSEFHSRRMTLLFCSNISIAKVFLVFHSANGIVRLDQGFFFQVPLRLCERFSFAKLKLSQLYLHAAYFVTSPRVSWEIRARQFIDLTKVLSRVA